EAFTLLSDECPPGSPLCIRESISLANEIGKPIEGLARSLVALTCGDQVQCVKTHTWLAIIYRSRGEPGTALKHRWQAAEHAGTAEAWLLMAREARKMGSKARASVAVENASRLPIRDSKLRQEIADLREKLDKNNRA